MPMVYSLPSPPASTRSARCKSGWLDSYDPLDVGTEYEAADYFSLPVRRDERGDHSGQSLHRLIVSLRANPPTRATLAVKFKVRSCATGDIRAFRVSGASLATLAARAQLAPGETLYAVTAPPGRWDVWEPVALADDEALAARIASAGPSATLRFVAATATRSG